MAISTFHPAQQNLAYHVKSHDEHLSFTDWTPGAISRWIGKCKHCKHAVRVEVRQDILLTWQYSTPDKLHFSKRTYRYEALTTGATHHMSKQGNYVLVTCPHGCKDVYGTNRWEEAATFTCKRIEGVYNDAVKCNAKCMNATGPHCECQCAGENHGAGHGIG